MQMIYLHFPIKSLAIYGVLRRKFEVNMKRICKSTPTIWKISMRGVWFCTHWVVGKIRARTALVQQSQFVRQNLFLDCCSSDPKVSWLWNRIEMIW
jgi:hypothetical protein